MKFANWLTRTIITAVIMTCVSITTTWVMVNAYVQQVIGSFGTASNLEPMELSDVLAALTGSSGGGVGPAAPSLSSSAGTEQPADGAANGVTGEPAEEDESEAYPVPDDALPVMGQATTPEEELYISMDDLNERKESLTAEDRMEIFTLLISKLPASEVQSISALLEDGFTAEEMEETSAILQQYLTQEEYEKLLQILMKS
ncbi:hypothetical protein MO973_31590 [Paenibacillus sp. TRM 82003]|nr:hypothetical protein [Paenibacillus sp. TRM 82003]